MPGNQLLATAPQRKDDRETWRWSEEVQESIQRTRLAKEKWDSQGEEESRQEYWEARHTAKREVTKAHSELFVRLDSKEGEKDLYQLARRKA